MKEESLQNFYDKAAAHILNDGEACNKKRYDENTGQMKECPVLNVFTDSVLSDSFVGTLKIAHSCLHEKQSILKSIEELFEVSMKNPITLLEHVLNYKTLEKIVKEETGIDWDLLKDNDYEMSDYAFTVKPFNFDIDQMKKWRDFRSGKPVKLSTYVALNALYASGHPDILTGNYRIICPKMSDPEHLRNRKIK